MGGDVHDLEVVIVLVGVRLDQFVAEGNPPRAGVVLRRAGRVVRAAQIEGALCHDFQDFLLRDDCAYHARLQLAAISTPHQAVD